MSNFEIVIASFSDRENLVAEIWSKEVLVAEINKEKEDFEIELYQSKNVTFYLDEFLDVLETAKIKLIGL